MLIGYASVVVMVRYCDMVVLAVSAFTEVMVAVRLYCYGVWSCWVGCLCCGLLIDSFAVGCCRVVNLPLCLCCGFIVISYPCCMKYNKLYVVCIVAKIVLYNEFLMVRLLRACDASLC